MENDLRVVRDKTSEQASHFRQKVDNKVHNVEALRQENEQLKNVINLYKNRLQKEVKKWMEQ
jgi:FtsZ-binding cell division protein ZapB